MSRSTEPKFDREKEYPAAELSRREFVAMAAGAAAGFVRHPSQARSAVVRTGPSTLPPYGNGTIPAGIRSRAVAGVNGLTVHMLEAGFERPGWPAVLLLHLQLRRRTPPHRSGIEEVN